MIQGVFKACIVSVVIVSDTIQFHGFANESVLLTSWSCLCLQIRHLKSKLQSQSKQRKFDGQVFEADGLDVDVDLAPHLDMALKSEPAGGLHDQQEGQQPQPQLQPQQHEQQQQEYQQLSTAAAAAVALTTGMSKESPVKSKGGAGGGGGGSTSSESNSSEIMNADSPHPIDSGLSPGVDQKAGFICGQLPSTAPQGADNADTSLVQFAEDLCGGRLVAPQPFQRIAVKVEDGVLSSNMLQEECSNYFYTMDDSGSLPWWDWP